MLFDGSEITLNDSVYDVAYGSGHVIELGRDDITFRVAFGPRSFTYDTHGFGTFPRKTLYWRNPVVFVPPKNVEKWDLLSKLQAVIASTLGL